MTFKKESIECRKTKFLLLLKPYSGKYERKMLVEFAEYWTEINLNGKKMRFEKEKTFGLSRRLATWKRNELKWNKPKNFISKTNAGLILLKKHGITKN